MAVVFLTNHPLATKGMADPFCRANVVVSNHGLDGEGFSPTSQQAGIISHQNACLN